MNMPRWAWSVGLFGLILLVISGIVHTVRSTRDDVFSKGFDRGVRVEQCRAHCDSFEIKYTTLAMPEIETLRGIEVSKADEEPLCRCLVEPLPDEEIREPEPEPEPKQEFTSQ